MAGLLVRCVGGPLTLYVSQVYCMIYSAVHGDNVMANADMAACGASKHVSYIIRKLALLPKLSVTLPLLSIIMSIVRRMLLPRSLMLLPRLLVLSITVLPFNP
jgi:hypothetical protein